MSEDTKKETNALLNSLLPFAKKMIIEYGEFYPYAGYMDPNGKMTTLAVRESNEKKNGSKEFIKLLETLLQGMCKENKVKAVGLIFDVKIPDPNPDSKTDAIEIVLEHKDGYAAEVFLPYTRKNDNVIFGKIFAQKGKTNFFVS